VVQLVFSQPGMPPHAGVQVLVRHPSEPCYAIRRAITSSCTAAGFSIGIRDAHDKSMRLAMTVGYRLW